MSARGWARSGVLALFAALSCLAWAAPRAEAKPEEPPGDLREEMLDVLRLYLQQGRWDEAVALADELLAEHPDDPAAMEGLVSACLESTACAPRREAVLRRAMKVFPDRAGLIEDLYELLMKDDRPVDAVAEVERFHAAYPDDGRGVALLADAPEELYQALVRLRRDRVAVRELGAFVERHPAHREAHLLLIDVLVERRALASAIIEVRRFLAREPGNAELRFLVADLYEELGRTRELDEEIASLRSRYPGDARVWVLAGERALARDDLDGVEAALRRARPLRKDADTAARLAALAADLDGTRAEIYAETYADFRSEVRWADVEDDLARVHTP